VLTLRDVEKDYTGYGHGDQRDRINWHGYTRVILSLVETANNEVSRIGNGRMRGEE
jgi:hypothetical protein